MIFGTSKTNHSDYSIKNKTKSKTENKHLYTAFREKCLLRQNALNTPALYKIKKSIAQEMAVQHDMPHHAVHA